MDGTCHEVIEVYIFKADPGEDDLGGAIDIVESLWKIMKLNYLIRIAVFICQEKRWFIWLSMTLSKKMKI